MIRGDRVRKLREQFGYSQNELAELVGIDKQQVWRIENNATNPSVDHVTLLVKALGVTADYILGLVDEPGEQVGQQELSEDEMKLIQAIRSKKFHQSLKALSRLIDDVE